MTEFMATYVFCCCVYDLNGVYMGIEYKCDKEEDDKKDDGIPGKLLKTRTVSGL